MTDSGGLQEEAPSFGKTIFEYDRNSLGARAYSSLTKEVLDRFSG